MALRALDPKKGARVPPEKAPGLSRIEGQKRGALELGPGDSLVFKKRKQAAGSPTGEIAFVRGPFGEDFSYER